MVDKRWVSLSLALSLLAFDLFRVDTVWAAQKGWVEATGEAQIQGGAKIAAKKAAVADALKRCVEEVVGVSIKSDFSAQQKEVVSNNKSEFESKVQDTLVQKSEGFIDTYKILDETTVGDVIKVKVRARVFASKIKAQIKKLTDLIAAAGNPKLMMIIQEVYVNEEGETEVSGDSVLGAYLEKELLSRGFELRGQGEARKIIGGSRAQFDAWLADANGVAESARGAGADLIIAGRLEIHDKGEITADEAGGLSALIGQTRVELNSVVRGVNAATGDVFSSKPVQMKSMGTSRERAVHRAFKGRGNNVVKQVFDDLLDDLKTSFRKVAEQGQMYVVKLGNVKSFRKQARRFMKIVRNAAAVQDVKQKSFREGRLVLDVACKCDADELQSAIFSASEDVAGFSDLDIEHVSGKQLSFRL